MGLFAEYFYCSWGYDLRKKGCIPKNINAGKKCIGIANPGNSSGNSTSKGRLILIGPKTLKKENKIIKMFTTPLNLDLFNFSNIQ